MDIGVYKAISAVQSELAGIGISKDKKNAQQGYNFRGIDDVYGTLAPILAKHGLCILPRVLSRDVIERQTKAGGALFYVTVGCEFDLVCAEDGSKHTVKTYGEAMDSGDKATNKAMSAAYKYAAFQAFCIPVDVEDADATTHDVKAKGGLSQSGYASGINVPAGELTPRGIKTPGTTPAPPVSTDAEKLKLASAGQVQQIQIIMKSRGFMDRDAILKDLSDFCRRDIHSSKTLTFDEAHAYIEANIGGEAA